MRVGAASVQIGESLFNGSDQTLAFGVVARRSRLRCGHRGIVAEKLASVPQARSLATLSSVTDEASRILNAALELPRAERTELAATLADSIGDGSSPEEAEATWIAEAKRRAVAIDRGELELVDSEEMMARVRARIGGRG